MSDENGSDMITQVRELFTQYDLRDAAVEHAKAELDKALQVRSEVVKQIGEMIAPAKRITRNGKELTLVVRGNTYFWRGKGKPGDTFEV